MNPRTIERRVVGDADPYGDAGGAEPRPYGHLIRPCRGIYQSFSRVWNCRSVVCSYFSPR